MPTWEITEDSTGQTLILEGDNAPNESDVIKAFSAFRGEPTIGVPQDRPWYQPIRDASSFLLGRTPDQVAADAQRVAQYGTAEQKAQLFDESGALRVKEGSSLKSDISRGIDQLQGIGYALGAGAADTVGATGTADWMLNRALLNQKQVEANPPDVGSVANLGVGVPSGIEGLGPRLRQSLSFVREAAGENLPLSAPSLGGGALVGNLTKRLAAKKLAEVASAQAARQLASAQLKGQVAGAFIPNVGIEAGSIYQDMAREGARGGKEFAVATLAALPAAALDSISDVAGLRRITGEANRAFTDRIMATAFGDRFVNSGLGKLTTAGLEQVITEAPTEYLQTGIEQAATFSQSPQLQGMFWQTFLGDKAALERVEAAIKGGAGGGAMGIGIGGIQALRRQDVPPSEEVRPTTSVEPVQPPTDEAQALSDAIDRRVAALDALAAQVAAEQDQSVTPTEGVQNAIQEQEASPEVLRTETPQPEQQLGLQEVAAEVRPTEEETVATQKAKTEGFTVGPVFHGSPDFVGESFSREFLGRETGLSRGGINFSEDENAARSYMNSPVDVDQAAVDAANRALNQAAKLIEQGTVIPGFDEPSDLPEFNVLNIDDGEEFREYLRELATKMPTDVASQLRAASQLKATKANPRLFKAFLKNPRKEVVNGKVTWVVDSPEQIRVVSTEQPKPSFGERAISKLESLKVKPGDAGAHSTFFPLLDAATARAIWNTSLDVAIGAIKAGQTIAQAVDAAVKWLKDSNHKFDETKVREALGKALEPETGPSGQTFTGPVRERDKTSPGQSSFYQSEGPARSETEDEKLATEQVASFGDDLDRAYSEAQKINEPAFRQVVMAEILARTMERLEKSNLHDVAMRNLAGRLSETFKAEGREAGQALQSRVQANEKLDPYKPLLSWLDMLRTQFEDQVRKPLGDKVGKIEEAFDKATRKASKKKTPKERETELDKELDKELEQAGIDKPTRKKIRSKKKKLLDVINDPNSTDEDILKALSEAFGIEAEDGETAKKLLKLTRKAQSAPEGLPRHKVTQEMMDLVFDKAPVDWHKLIQDIWFGSVLMRLGTFLNVAVGSSTTSVMNLGLQMIDRAARGGDIKGAARILHQYMAGLIEGARIGTHIARTGDYSVLPDFQDRADRFFRGQMKPDQLEAMLRKKSLASIYPGKLAYTRRIMTALDYIFATATRDSSVLYSALTRKDQESVDKLARKWDKTATRLADEQASNELGPKADKAEIAVRRRQILEEGVAVEEKAAAAHLARRVAGNADPQGVPGLLYGFVQAGANWIDKQVPGGGFVAKVVTGTPFLRASMNMMQNAMDLFPGVGIAKATLGTGKAPIKLLQRDIFKTTPEEQRMQVVGSLVGMAATVGLGSLVLLDKDEEKDRKFDVTGSWSGFTQQQKKQMMDGGMRPYSFGVVQKDGTTKWISYRQSPLIGIFATIGYLRDHQRKDPQEYEATPKAEWVVGAGISGALAIKDFSALSGLTSIFNYSAQGVDDPKDLAEKTSRFLSQAVGRPASGFIPSVVKELDEFLDPTLYRENGDKITGYWLRNIPLARRAVGEGPDLNIFGEPVKQTRPPLRSYLSSQDSNEPAWRALSHALNNGVFPTYVSETAMVTDGGQRRRMTEPEFYRYREAFGKLMKQRLNADAENLLKLDRPRLEQYFDGRGAIWDSMRVTARQQAFSKK